MQLSISGYAGMHHPLLVLFDPELFKGLSLAIRTNVQWFYDTLQMCNDQEKFMT